MFIDPCQDSLDSLWFLWTYIICTLQALYISCTILNYAFFLLTNTVLFLYVSNYTLSVHCFHCTFSVLSWTIHFLYMVPTVYFLYITGLYIKCTWFDYVLFMYTVFVHPTHNVQKMYTTCIQNVYLFSVREVLVNCSAQNLIPLLMFDEIIIKIL